MDTTHRPRTRVGLTPIRSVGLAASAALLVTATLAPSGALVLAGSYSQPDAALGAGIVVDGNLSEWAATDVFAPMYRAGKATKELESTLYLRYDCGTGTLYAMVETSAGVTLDTSSNADQFVKIDGPHKVAGNDGTGTFALSGDLRAWEASAVVAAGVHDLDVHASVIDDGPQGSAVEGRSVALEIDCSNAQAPAEASSSPSEDPGAGASADPSAAADPSADPSVAPSEAPSVVPSEAPSVVPSGDPGAGASADPSAAADPSVDPSAAPSTEPGAEAIADPSPSARPSVEPSSEPGLASDASPSLDPTTDPSAEPSASASPSTGPDFGGDPDPHDQVNGPTGICGCEPSAPVGQTAASADPAQGAVLGLVGVPSTTLPPTDTFVAPSPSSGGTALRLALVLLAAVLAGLALAPVRRRSAGDDAIDS